MNETDNPFGVKIGQIWKDNDPRGYRQIRITGFTQHLYPSAVVENHTLDGNRQGIACRPIALKRFNGRRNGYVLFRDVDGKRVTE